MQQKVTQIRKRYSLKRNNSSKSSNLRKLAVFFQFFFIAKIYFGKNIDILYILHILVKMFTFKKSNSQPMWTCEFMKIYIKGVMTQEKREFPSELQVVHGAALLFIHIIEAN